MKKIIFIISLMISILIFSMLIVDKMPKKELIEEVAEVVAEPELTEVPVEWHGNYIWDNSSTNNTWMCFRKKIILDQEYEEVMTQIAVDSKYWLYINDEMIVREGGLKRGETRNSIYYDEIDLGKYLKKGENTIAILVWYWGGISLSHNSSGQGAMLFQAQFGNTYLVSDQTWKVAKHEAYGQDPLRPNQRLIEYNIYYDANKSLDEWYKSSFDDSGWQDAIILGMAGDYPWGDMVERNIPQFKNYEITEYENMLQYAEYITLKDEILEMTIPHNAQFMPYLKIEAPKGKKVTIKTDQYADVNGDSVKCTYFTKEGIQEFESFAWMNGEKVYYEIPEGVKVISLGYRETGYNTEMTGCFKSDDEFFNRLWEMASRTLYVNMRDSYMDCPNRERAQWAGDMSVEIMQAMYALDMNAYDLYEKGIKTIIGWRDQKTLLTVAPITDGYLHLPVQMMALINSMYEYYEYTGKVEFLEYMYPYVKDYLNCWQENENGLMACNITYPLWEWGDSVAKCDYKAIENAFVYLALDKTKDMAKSLGYNEDVQYYNTQLEKLKVNYNKLWTTDGYKTSESEFVDERANAIAVISGLADEEKYEKITEILTTSYDATVYMEKYVLEALCEMGKLEEAQQRIKYRYQEMVSGEKACSTLWENWVYDIGTKNHAWSGGPLIIMSKYFAGIEPLKSGYDEILIKPQFGNLNSIFANTTTIKGDVKMYADKFENGIYMKVTTPEKTLLAIPKCGENMKIIINNKKVYQKGKFKKDKLIQNFSEDKEYFYFYVENGEYEIKVINER